MRDLLKVWLPPFTGFLIYFTAIRYSGLYFTLKIDEMGYGNLVSFMAYYRYLLPLLFVVAILTQYLITNPIYRFLKGSAFGLKIAVIADLFLICLLFSAVISYTIWSNENGVLKLLKLIAFMMAVQAIYWAINLVVLKLLEKPAIKTDPSLE